MMTQIWMMIMMMTLLVFVRVMIIIQLRQFATTKKYMRKNESNMIQSL